MTEHPLTDDFCHWIAELWLPDAAEKDKMRSAADWQLEQCLQFVLLNYGQEAMVLFMEAMRPTNTQENNNG